MGGQWVNRETSNMFEVFKERERESQATGLMGNVAMVLCLAVSCI